MQPSFSVYHEGYGAELVCPSCGGNCLHHDRIDIFERGEDQDQGIHVLVAEGQGTFNTDLAGNPSARRDGLSIHFWCEDCSAKPVLTIAQHKCNAFVNFK